MMIDKVVQKKYEERDCTWYYCTDKYNDIINGHAKAIFIHNRLDKSIIYAYFANEVTVFWCKIYLK